ncbi:hypothetical protein PtrSN002B_006575 [Pyrenophora tritici-repentis]|nr:hypothetical protein PtrV1_11307 [Pyrenophora tritici-repentis]KAF7443495.1 hypothetical protein A1F99_115690 [Pyrenophora tritici-repentis]KAF7566790.1 hypothetical protein PtrM4_151100 [Pyrenophora tritici-repentis]KAG9379232.1 hypothetical protein A1F94_009588 [Pyrenophora tritici-repentis]KAI0579609.1 hypothetical protein Alg215_05674 [Pyrenophora tritici-repentis]
MAGPCTWDEGPSEENFQYFFLLTKTDDGQTPANPTGYNVTLWHQVPPNPSLTGRHDIVVPTKCWSNIIGILDCAQDSEEYKDQFNVVVG